MVSTNIQVIVFLFNIFKATKLPTTLLPQTTSLIRNNSNLTMLALALNFIYKLLKKVYKLQRKKVLEQYPLMSSQRWKNDYPIVLVHGFGGFTPDESLFFGNYFGYPSDQAVQGENLIYQADVSPFSSLHDRACELYQQMIGIFETQRLAEENGHNLAEQVYGKHHASEDHKEDFYKPRYLRRVIQGKLLAYPNGIPGGWNYERRVHFVGHSQGAQTVRYLQHLLKIDFFNDSATKLDKSDWVASFTGINPILNGGLATYLFNYCLDKHKFVSPKEGGNWKEYVFVEGCKVFPILQNLIQPQQTMNNYRERVLNVMSSDKEDKNEIIWEMGMQPYFFFDFNNENVGSNKRPNESIMEYMKRVMASNRLYETTDFGFAEFIPYHTKFHNAQFELNPNTYYFSCAAGIRQRNYMKQREVLREPQRITKMGVGFDLDADHNLYYQGQLDKIPEKPNKQLGLVNRWLMSGKVALNFVSIAVKTFSDSFTHLTPAADHLNNFVNPDMNNVMAIDYANKDWINDGDMILPRWTQEYPKISSEYKTKDTAKKPWGNTPAPIYFDQSIDSQLMTHFEKGVWYYSSVSQSDHHDFAGFESRFSYIWQTMCGLEYRTQFWINTFNRIRSLEYKDQPKHI